MGVKALKSLKSVEIQLLRRLPIRPQTRESDRRLENGSWKFKLEAEI